MKMQVQTQIRIQRKKAVGKQSANRDRNPNPDVDTDTDTYYRCRRYRCRYRYGCRGRNIRQPVCKLQNARKKNQSFCNSCGIEKTACMHGWSNTFLRMLAFVRDCSRTRFWRWVTHLCQRMDSRQTVFQQKMRLVGTHLFICRRTKEPPASLRVCSSQENISMELQFVAEACKFMMHRQAA